MPALRGPTPHGYNLGVLARLAHGSSAAAAFWSRSGRPHPLRRFATAQVSNRWFESFSIPGYSAYETNQKVLKNFGTGEQAPFVAVFQSSGDVTQQDLQPAIEAAAAVTPGSRASSYFDTHNAMYVSKDKHTTFAEIYPPGQNTFSSTPKLDEIRAALKDRSPPSVTTNLTGLIPLYDASSNGDGDGPSVLTEALIGGVGALIILLFVFGTLPAVGIPLQSR